MANNKKVVWKSHIRNLFDEALLSSDLKFMRPPFQITMDILAEAARYAAKSGDEKMIGYFCRLALYTFSDPTHPDFDIKLTNKYVNLTKN